MGFSFEDVRGSGCAGSLGVLEAEANQGDSVGMDAGRGGGVNIDAGTYEVGSLELWVMGSRGGGRGVSESWRD